MAADAHHPPLSQQQQPQAGAEASAAPDGAQPEHGEPAPAPGGAAAATDAAGNGSDIAAPSSSSSSSSSSETSSTISSSSSASSSSSSLWASAQPLVVRCLAPAALLLAAFAWLLRRRRRGRSGDVARGGSAAAAAAAQEAAEPPSTLSLWASDFELLNAGDSGRQLALLGLQCVVSENVAVQGAAIGAGMPPLAAELPLAGDHAPVVRKLVNLGFSIVAQTSTQPCNYPNLGANLRNPAGRFRVAGGGATGTAVAVARRHAELGVGADWLGSVRLPAACTGLYGFVCTPGALGGPGARDTGSSGGEDGSGDSGSGRITPPGVLTPPSDRSSGSRRSRGGVDGGSLETMGLLAADLRLLCRVASFLGLPGTATLRHDITQIVVAEDLFQLCEPELAPGLTAVKRAVLSWAGQDQAGSVQLLPFLADNTGGWKQLLAAADSTALGAATTGDGQPLPPVLRALTYAAQLLYHAELSKRYAAAAAAAAESVAEQEAEEAALATAVGAGGAGAPAPAPAGPVASSTEPWQLDNMVAAALQAGAEAQPEQLALARQVAREVQDLLKTAVKKDVVVVVPCVPSAPPRLDAPQAAASSWLARCHAFAALTSLGGCPTLVLPVGQLAAGGGQLSLALFGQSRSDQRLLAVADKLVPKVQDEISKMQAAAAAEAAAAAAAVAARSGKGSGKGKAGRQEQPSEVDPRRVERAEKAKTRGNEAFKAGRYREAIAAYSEALKLAPGNPVYHNNRAMAHLKVFSFEAAEQDCNAALAAPQLGAADRVKALLRRGTARVHKGDLRGARADFQTVLQAEPNNRQAREELKALKQQEQDMAQTRRSMLGPGGGGAGNGAPYQGLEGLGLPDFESLDQMDPAAAAAVAARLGNAAWDGGAYPGPDAGGAYGPGGLDHQQLAAMLDSGGMSVVLGEDGQPVSGPAGEPVIVGPEGQELAIEPSGRVKPYRSRKRSSAS